MKTETINIKIRPFSNYVKAYAHGVHVLCATTACHVLQSLPRLLELSDLKEGVANGPSKALGLVKF